MSRNGRLVAVLGPTAVGKTELAIGLAKRLDGEIISGDSMLVYRGFDIGTAKPTVEERQGIAHHLVDVLEADESFSVVEFKEAAERLVEAVQERRRLPILAGGTALYVKSLLEGYDFCGTRGDAECRKRLERIAQEQGKDALHALLRQRDPAAAERIHPNNVRRVVRALEVVELGEERISTKREFASGGGLHYDAWVIGLSRPREQLYARIDERVLRMFEQGLEQEVRGLLDRGIARDSQPMQGIGYKETAAWLLGELTREQAIERIQSATRHFAKRQMTWYRQMPYIHWYDAASMRGEQLLETVISDASKELV